MEDKIKIRGQLKTYLAWPLLLSLFLICGNVAVALVKPLGGGGDVSVYRMLYSGGSVDLSVPEKADAGRTGGVLC